MARTKKAKVVSKEPAPAETPAPTLNKAKEVRDYFANHPKASPKEVSAALMAQGKDINGAYVSIVKFQMKQAKKKKRAAAAAEAGSPAKSQAVGGADSFSVATLMQAKKLAESLGGVEAAREALTALSKLLG